jgi:PIN like domain
MHGHPDGLPGLFLDRSLGRRQVPDLLRAAGLQLQTLAEVYGIPADEDVADVDWLELAGRRGWGRADEGRADPLPPR